MVEHSRSCLLGLLLTGSRGGTLAYIVVIFAWLLRRKRLSDLILAVGLAGLLATAVPERVWERLTLGFDDVHATNVDNMDDPLTKVLWIQRIARARHIDKSRLGAGHRLSGVEQGINCRSILCWIGAQYVSGYAVGSRYCWFCCVDVSIL